MKKIAVVNHKGGVAKTTSAQNLGASLALLGFKTLLMDLDSQMNLTLGFGIFTKDTDIKTINDSFTNGDPLNIIKVKDYQNLFIVPSSSDFASIETQLALKQVLAKEKILSKLLKPHEDEFDFCIMDCPPSLGLVSINALTTADFAIIPMDAEYYALTGLETIRDMINDVKEELNPKLSIAGVFFTRLKPNLTLSKVIKEQVEGLFGNTLLKSSISVNVALAECQSNGQDIFAYSPKSKGADDYRKLSQELLKRFKLN
jgi:chromosome partitioning protein